MTLSGAALGFLAEVFLYREVSFFCSKNETKPACSALGTQHRGRDQHGRGFIFLTRSKTSQEERTSLYFLITLSLKRKTKRGKKNKK